MVGGPGGRRRSHRVRDGRGDICDRASWAGGGAGGGSRSVTSPASGRATGRRASVASRSCRVVSGVR